MAPPGWVLLLVGLPGSGKSTFRKQVVARMAAGSSPVIINPDQLRLDIHGRPFDPAHEPAVWSTVYRMARGALESGANLLVDATNLNRRRRRPFIQLAAEFGAAAWAIFFDVGLSLALRRNSRRAHPVPAPRIRDMAQWLEPPSRDEGLNAVAVLTKETGEWTLKLDPPYDVHR